MQYIYLILTWLLLTSAAPFTFYLIPGHPYKILTAAVLILLIGIILIKRQIKILDWPLFFIILLQAIYACAAYLYHQDPLYLNLLIFYVSALITYLFLGSYIKIMSFAGSVIGVMLIMGAMGAVVFVLGLLGLIQPFTFHLNADGRTAFNFLLTFSNSVIVFGKAMIIRVAGYFDEPGTFAFFTIYALAMNKLSFDKKWVEAGLIIFGLFTLSMYFYISLVLYFIFFHFNIRSIRSMLSAMLIMIALIATLSATNNNAYMKLYELTFDRFSISDESGKIVKGDNRSDLMANAAYYISDAPLMGQGMSNARDNLPFLGANILGPLAINGIIGFFFIFLPVWYMCAIAFFPLRGQWVFDSKMAGCALLILVNYLQRPDVIGLFNYIVIVVVIQLMLIRRRDLLNKTAGADEN